MPQDQQWPESHTERTDVLPTVGAQQAGDQPTQHIPSVPPAPQADADATQQISATPPPAGEGKRRFRKPALVAGGVLGALVLAYAVDLLVSSGDVPRGVTVAGVDVGGMTHSRAEDTLRQELEPRMTEPVDYVAGDVRKSFDPAKAGLQLDWSATLEEAGDQPLNPITRITSLFTEREVGVVTQAEPNQLDNAMAGLQQQVDHDPVEGDITFEGATPKAVDPKNGQKLDVDAARQTILDNWASDTKLSLPVSETPVTVPAEAVEAALTDIAEPAVSAPVTVHGQGADGTLEPEEIAAGLSFEPKDGALTPKLDQKKLVAGVGPELAGTEQDGKDAEIVFEGGSPTVKPSVDGNKINWKKTLEPLLDVLKSAERRELTATYEHKPAKLTTDAANKLGINEVIGEFTTGDFASDSGVNIQRVAEEVDGAIVKPGETFSLNTHTGPRTEAQGYVPAGIIENGEPGEAVGGGISQFATTIYNASYFAGMTDAGHKEHSYYISRYPPGREATVYQNPDGSSVIDVAFTNESKTGVAIQTEWTPSSITVKLWGTKQYDVESITGDQTNPVQPGTQQSDSPDCEASSGIPGFTITDTRVLKDPNSGAVVREEPRTVTYSPKDAVVCKPPKGD